MAFRVPGRQCAIAAVLLALPAALAAQDDQAIPTHLLRDPCFNNSSTVRPAFGLSDAQLHAIVAYLRSLGG
ncbi:MAG TPA: hypothetical protein VK837_14470 [Longimicrobiales bacterium]|nr:hypothetical protein [Longimicrobiales bacterium]